MVRFPVKSELNFAHMPTGHVKQVCFCLMQAVLQDVSSRPCFRPAKQDIWYGMRALIRLTHAGALAALLQSAPALLGAIFEEATSAERKSFTAVECLHEVLAILGPQVNAQNMYSISIQTCNKVTADIYTRHSTDVTYPMPSTY